MNNTGECLCGAVRYSISTEPAFVGVCHCGDCQKFTGSAFSYLVAFAKADIHIHGELETFSKTGDSGQPILRQFCPKCGSSILEVTATRPELVLLNGGTLDNSAEFSPTVQIYCDRELPWAQLSTDIQRYPSARE
ncbi:MAG: GFA family protein [Halioglobus sp.]